MKEFEMVCVCHVTGVQEVEARRLRIFRRMGLDDMGDLTTAIVLSLAFDFKADAEIAADMWFGVSVTSPLVEGGLYVQCDWPADGLAVIWEQLVEQFPEAATAKGAATPSHVRVAERISAALLSQYEGAEAAYGAHRKAAHAGPNDCPPCEDCSVALTLEIAAHQTLDRAWSTDVLEPAIAKAYGE
jgi:hypothetical protein